MITNKIIKINDSQNAIKSQLLDFASRYNRSDLIYYSDFKILTFETYDRELKNLNISSSGDEDIKFYLITQGAEYKPWLVSQEAYGDPGYWWIIMEFNNIFDVEDFEAGKTIKIPPATSILQ